MYPHMCVGVAQNQFSHYIFLNFNPWQAKYSLKVRFFCPIFFYIESNHYCDVIMGAMASQITSLTIVYSTVYSGTDQRKHQSSTSLAFVRGIHRRPVNSLHKWPVARKMFPFENVMKLNFFFVKLQLNNKWSVSIFLNALLLNCSNHTITLILQGGMLLSVIMMHNTNYLLNMR